MYVHIWDLDGVAVLNLYKVSSLCFSLPPSLFFVHMGVCVCVGNRNNIINIIGAVSASAWCMSCMCCEEDKIISFELQEI